jgi:hypothetical protein
LNVLVRRYWRERLEEGNIFFHGPKEWGVDYRTRRGDDPNWPREVAKGAMVSDYHQWVKTLGPGGVVTESEFFLEVGSFLYILGKTKHTVRRNTAQQVHVGGGRLLEGRVQKYFLRLAPLDVLRAQAAILSGGLSESELVEPRRVVAGFVLRNIIASVSLPPQLDTTYGM